MYYRVKKVRKFILNYYQPNKFNLGDIVFFEPNNVGVVIGYSKNGDIITDVAIPESPRRANIYEIEKYRNILIPHIRGVSYVEIIDHNKNTTEYIIVNKETAIGEFKNICASKNIPITNKNSLYIVSEEYHLTLNLFIN